MEAILIILKFLLSVKWCQNKWKYVIKSIYIRVLVLIPLVHGVSLFSLLYLFMIPLYFLFFTYVLKSSWHAMWHQHQVHTTVIQEPVHYTLLTAVQFPYVIRGHYCNTIDPIAWAVLSSPWLIISTAGSLYLPHPLLILPVFPPPASLAAISLFSVFISLGSTFCYFTIFFLDLTYK